MTIIIDQQPTLRSHDRLMCEPRDSGVYLQLTNTISVQGLSKETYSSHMALDRHNTEQLRDYLTKFLEANT